MATIQAQAPFVDRTMMKNEGTSISEKIRLTLSYVTHEPLPSFCSTCTPSFVVWSQPNSLARTKNIPCKRTRQHQSGRLQRVSTVSEFVRLALDLFVLLHARCNRVEIRRERGYNSWIARELSVCDVTRVATIKEREADRNTHEHLNPLPSPLRRISHSEEWTRWYG